MRPMQKSVGSETNRLRFFSLCILWVLVVLEIFNELSIKESSSPTTTMAFPLHHPPIHPPHFCLIRVGEAHVRDQ
jgi:hypothetical protein